MITGSPAAGSDGASAPAVIEVAHLRNAYGPAVAVEDVSFAVGAGEIFGILGPNGAGKTTTVECVIGLRTRDGGSIRVMGLDPARDRDREQLHQIVGVQLQASALPGKLRVAEILDLYRSFYRNPADVGELIESLGLTDKLRDSYYSLSGGQRQRLSVALALIGNPHVAVLDEMTTSLDPHARRETWELIEGIRDRGVTIVLVTHFMEEAERLCDRAAMIDRGQIIALDTPAGLIAQARGGKQVSFKPSAPFDDQMLLALPEVHHVEHVEHNGSEVIVTGTGELVNAVILALHGAGVIAHDVALGSSTLEDAFLALTGLHPDRNGRPA